MFKKKLVGFDKLPRYFSSPKSLPRILGSNFLYGVLVTAPQVTSPSHWERRGPVVAAVHPGSWRPCGITEVQRGAAEIMGLYGNSMGFWEFYGDSMGILWDFGNFMGILWGFYGDSMGFWGFYGDSMGILWDFGNFMGILWGFYGILGILWGFYGILGILWGFYGILGILWDLIGFNGNIMGPSPPNSLSLRIIRKEVVFQFQPSINDKVYVAWVDGKWKIFSNQIIPLSPFTSFHHNLGIIGFAAWVTSQLDVMW